MNTKRFDRAGGRNVPAGSSGAPEAWRHGKTRRGTIAVVCVCVFGGVRGWGGAEPRG